MRLQSLKYIEHADTPQEWSIEGLSLGQTTLIVGKNATGKSRTLNVIGSLAAQLSGRRSPSLSGRYECRFIDAADNYTYFLTMHEEEVTAETLQMNGNVMLERKTGGQGTIYAEEKAARPDTGQQYYVLLVDCGGDDLVKSRIMEEHEKLTRNNYSRIIGIRDVRPKYTLAEIPSLERGLPKYIKTALIPVDFVLSIMEIEAWFLAEFNHFPRIHHSITIDAIRRILGFDPSVDDMAQRPNPTDDMQACYAIGGEIYEKANTAKTIAALDPAFVYLELTKRIPYLKGFTTKIDEFLAA